MSAALSLSREQAAVVGAPLRPAVVVAGAGSGKTETMANRVVALVADGAVEPDRVLGLTFTRKAAAELADRIRRKLREGGLGGPDGEPTVSTYDAFAARIVTEHAMRIGREPRVEVLRPAASYALAAAVVDRFDGQVVPEVSGWPGRATLVAAVCQLHERLTVHRRTPAELVAFSDRQLADLLSVEPSTRTGEQHGEVKKLIARERPRAVIAELVVRYRAVLEARGLMDFASVAALAAELARDPAVRAAERASAGVVLLDEFQDTNPVQLDLLAGLFEGSAVTAVGDPNQAIFAWRGAGSDTMGEFRARFGDADCLELHLSTSYRNPPPVLTVANALAAPLTSGAHPGSRRLWVPELRSADRSAQSSTHPSNQPSTDPLPQPSTGPSGDPSGGAAAAAPVVCSRFATEPREARAVAAAAATALDTGGTVAVLVRTRRQIPVLLSAMRATGVPVAVVGLNGLLGVPAVVDVVSVLQVLADADSGTGLMRLLAGSRWRIGPDDLRALQRSARDLLAPGGGVGQPASPPDEPVAAGPLADPDVPGIVDALDRLVDLRAAAAGGPVRGAPTGLSAIGLERLRRLGAELRELRARLDQPLADLVVDVVRTIGIDVELAAAPLGTAGTQADLDSFVAEADAFAAAAGSAAFTPSTGSRGRLDRSGGVAAGGARRLADTARAAVSLVGFLAFLELAEDTERGLDRDESALDLGDGAGGRGVVDLLTVHAAKGLEWDAVFVPGMSEAVFPTGVRSATGWLTDVGEIPGPMRRDAAGQPELAAIAGAPWVEAKESLDDFKRQVTELHLAEERRLAYVAVTRARSLLWCSGHGWVPDLKKPRKQSVFLTEIRALATPAAVASPLPGDPAVPTVDTGGADGGGAGAGGGGGDVRIGVWEPDGDDPTTTGDPDFVVAPRLWPADPVGRVRRPDVEAGAGLVRAAMGRLGRAGSTAGVQPARDRPRPGGAESPGQPADEGGAGSSDGVESPGGAGYPDGGGSPGGAGYPDGGGSPGGAGSSGDAELDRWTADTAAICAAAALPAWSAGELFVELPADLSVSEMVVLARDPGVLAGLLRRPMPQPPRPAADLGTAFHEWLEQRWTQEELIDLDDLPGASDTDVEVFDEDALQRLQESFAASEWGGRTPAHQEFPFLMPLGPVVLRGRIDAVFTDDRSGIVDIVDWKTGRAPGGAAELAAVAVQLAAYRLAWHRLQGVPLDRIRAGFHYVPDGRTVRPADLLDAAGLSALVTRPEGPAPDRDRTAVRDTGAPVGEAG